MTIQEKQHSGEIYQPMDQEILDKQLGYLDRLRDYNSIPHVRMADREAKLKELFAEVGEGCYVESPFYANFGGRHVHLGKNVTPRGTGTSPAGIAV